MKTKFCFSFAVYISDCRRFLSVLTPKMQQSGSLLRSEIGLFRLGVVDFIYHAFFIEIIKARMRDTIAGQGMIVGFSDNPCPFFALRSFTTADNRNGADRNNAIESRLQ